MKQLLGIVAGLLVLLLGSCGGPDRKDPQSVADAAIRCYAEENVAGMKKLFNPADKEKQEGIDQFIKMLEAMRDKGVQESSKKDRPAFEDYTVKSVKDPFGYPLNDNTKEVNVRYSCSTGKSMTVELEKIDGNWYLKTFPY